MRTHEGKSRSKKRGIARAAKQKDCSQYSARPCPPHRQIVCSCPAPRQINSSCPTLHPNDLSFPAHRQIDFSLSLSLKLYLFLLHDAPSRGVGMKRNAASLYLAVSLCRQAGGTVAGPVPAVLGCARARPLELRDASPLLPPFSCKSTALSLRIQMSRAIIALPRNYFETKRIARLSVMLACDLSAGSSSTA